MCEVNQVGSYDRAPMVLLYPLGERVQKPGKKLRKGEVENRRNSFEMTVTKAEAKWFAKLLYRRIKITIEDAGPMDDEEVAAVNEDGRQAQLTLEEAEAEGVRRPHLPAHRLGVLT
jgi:hypothetical protein